MNLDTYNPLPLFYEVRNFFFQFGAIPLYHYLFAFSSIAPRSYVEVHLVVVAEFYSWSRILKNDIERIGFPAVVMTFTG